MASKGMTDAWNGAWAAKPADWRLMGVACGPREADPKVHSAEGAWAGQGAAAWAEAAGRRMRC